MSLAVAPVSILRKHLGASRLRSLTLTATRPWPARRAPDWFAITGATAGSATTWASH